MRSKTTIIVPAILLLLLLISTPAAAQVVQGKVVAAGTGQPITAAEVVLQTDSGVVSTRAAQAITDTLGAFRLAAPAPGQYTLQVRRLGYATHTTKVFDVKPEEALVLEIIMSTEVLQLDSLVVVERRRFATPGLARFHERAEWVRRTGRGRVFFEEDLKRWFNVGMLLSFYARPSRNCPAPVVLVDGVPVVGSELNFFLHDSDLVYAVEIYRRWDEIPPEFKTADVCGVAVIWTKPPEGKPFTPRRLFFASSIAALLFLFTYK